jgi:hypothetical protein
MTTKASVPVLPWCDVIGFIERALVNLGPGYKAFDVDCVRALYFNRFQLVLVDFHVLALAELIAASFVRGIDRAASLLIDICWRSRCPVCLLIW